MENKKNASIFIYILLLINLALLIWYFVFNNISILDNNISIWNNAENVFKNVYDNGNINIETVRMFNSNWNWYIDGISCPTNITMSWSTMSWSSLTTVMVNKLWSIYCEWDYNWDEFRIYFNQDFSDFEKAYYNWYVVDLVYSFGYIDWTTNIARSINWAVATWTTPRYNWGTTYYSYYSNDWNYSSRFDTENRNSEYLNLRFPSEKSVWTIKIYKNAHNNWSNYWNNATVRLINNVWTEVGLGTISWAKNDTYIEMDFKYRWITADVRDIRFETENSYIDIEEFEVYELLSTGGWASWIWDTTFWDTDSTLISFNSDWVGWNDNIDDDLNSDNYRVTSSDWNYYADWYQDDDVIPRLFVFWNIDDGQEMYNIYWSNYKTLEFIDNNTNNNDILNIKMWNISDWLLYLDMFSPNDITFDIKIIEFDAVKFQNEYTLFPLKSFKWTDLNNYIWYIQNNSWSLDLSTVKTWNEYVFDFQNKDYAIFITNKTVWDVSFRLNWETQSGTWIYINPIDDSFTGIIKTVNNHMIIWEMEQNFIWENFIVVWQK